MDIPTPPAVGQARTHERSIELAAKAYANALALCEQMTPREQAEAAYQPGGPSVDDLEDRIRVRRGIEPLNRSGQDTPPSS